MHLHNRLMKVVRSEPVKFRWRAVRWYQRCYHFGNGTPSSYQAQGSNVRAREGRVGHSNRANSAAGEYATATSLRTELTSTAL